MSTPALILNPWVSLLLAAPVVLAGEWIVQRVKPLARFAIPAPVVSGLLVAAAAFALQCSDAAFGFELKTSHRAWTWWTTAEPLWRQSPAQAVHTPLLGVFFACVGLSASWPVVRRAGAPVALFLGLATVFAVVQNGIGLGVAELLGVSPLLGLVCGSMSLTGGHATTLGFAAEFERHGLAGAQTLGTAAATFGLVAGALMAGPVGRSLIQRKSLSCPAPSPARQNAADPARPGLASDLRRLAQAGATVVTHLAVLALCLKAGAWISHLLQKTGMSFPVFVGTMIAGIAVRNAGDAAGVRWFDARVVDAISSVALALFLAVAMMSLDLAELTAAAAPMLAILAVQVASMAAFAWWVTFRVMGRDYEAAIIAGGHCGFGLGSTTTAIAGMKAIVEGSGPSPRAFLIVPLVGGFLLDITNAVNLTAFLNLLHP